MPDIGQITAFFLAAAVAIGAFCLLEKRLLSAVRTGKLLANEVLAIKKTLEASMSLDACLAL
jgi:hypothetical protein